MNREHPRPSSHLSTLRLWVELLGSGQQEVRYKVQHVLSGETRYFRDGSALVRYLAQKLQELDSEERP